MRAAAGAVVIAQTSVPGWSVHLPTAGATTMVLACRRRDNADPWPLSDAVTALQRLGGVRADRPHAVGAGRGIPIMHTQSLQLGGCDIELRSVHCAAGDDEVLMTLPAWDELPALLPSEDVLWELCDEVAATCDVRAGCIDDGETFTVLQRDDGSVDVQSMLRRHIGLLLPAAHAAALAPGVACIHRELAASGLCVVLR